jgi:hypothetical protein
MTDRLVKTEHIKAVIKLYKTKSGIKNPLNPMIIFPYEISNIYLLNRISAPSGGL